MQRNPSFEEKIRSIHAEIELALRWQTPIIVVGLYANEHVLQDAQTQLSQQLSSSQQNLIHIRLTQKKPNLVDLLKDSDTSQAVFSVTGFEDGGGNDQADSYRFLNLHREYFIETRTRILLWLKPNEFQKMALYAPDFWAFRHLVFDFSDNRSTPKRSAKFEGIPIQQFPWDVVDNELEAALAYRQKALTEMPATNETLAFRLDLHGEIAGIFFAQQKRKKASLMLDNALRLIPDGHLEQIRSKILLGMAVIFISDDLPLQAEALLLQAKEISALSPAHYTVLSQSHRLSGRNSEALIAAQKALRNTPENAALWNEVGNIHANLGHFEDSLNAYQKAYSHANDPRILINQAALFLSVGRNKEAENCLQGLDKQILDMVGANSTAPVYELLKTICA